MQKKGETKKSKKTNRQKRKPKPSIDTKTQKRQTKLNNRRNFQKTKNQKKTKNIEITAKKIYQKKLRKPMQ